MEEDNEGFRYPITDKTFCNDCGLCEQVCPVITRYTIIEYETKIFACKNKDENVRRKSSSGGIFTILAEHIIQQNGIVFGARFDHNFAVIHDFTETIEGLEDFRGSKYLQSLVLDNFTKAEYFLKQGRDVLFTGTPCQISGLKHFLRKEYNNLLAIDIVCHGVPSPKVFKNYLGELSLHNEGITEKIMFRDKTEGWKNYSFMTKRKDGKNTITFRQIKDNNIYMRGFLQNLYLRPSCHACPSKELTSGSDLTLADYWGIEQIHPDFDDDKGCSMVICNNIKGELIFKEIKSKVETIKTLAKYALQGNPCIVYSVTPHLNRDKFFNQIENKQIGRIIKNLTKPTILELFVQAIYKFRYKIKIKL